MRLTHLLAAGVTGAAMTFSAACVQGQIFVYEGFELEPAGQRLLGQGSGTGFRDVWEKGGFNAQSHDNYEIARGSLEFPGLATKGNRVTTVAQPSIRGLSRYFTEPLDSAQAKYYLSFLIRPEGELSDGAFNGFLGMLLEQPQEPELFIGKPGAGAERLYVLEERGNPGQVSSAEVVQVGKTTLIVVKLEFDEGPDRFTLYINPVPGQPEPQEQGILKVGGDLNAVQGFTLYSTGAYSLDEIRLATDFASVVPVAEGQDKLPVAEVEPTEPPK